jgi:hypothetical protein
MKKSGSDEWFLSVCVTAPVLVGLEPVGRLALGRPGGRAAAPDSASNMLTGKAQYSDHAISLASPASDLVCSETILMDGGFTSL